MPRSAAGKRRPVGHPDGQIVKERTSGVRLSATHRLSGMCRYLSQVNRRKQPSTKVSVSPNQDQSGNGGGKP